jgi:hypothetical protein
MVQQGELAAYVQRRLAHVTIQWKVETYGKWLPWSVIAPWIAETTQIFEVIAQKW